MRARSVLVLVGTVLALPALVWASSPPIVSFESAFVSAWWAARLDVAGGTLGIDLEFQLLGDDSLAPGGALVAVLGADGASVWSLARVAGANEVSVGVSAASVLPASVAHADGGADHPAMERVHADVVLPAGPAWVVLVHAGEPTALSFARVTVSGVGSVAAVANGSEAFAVSARDFQCAAGAVASSQGEGFALPLPGGPLALGSVPRVRVESMDLCHVQAQLHESFFGAWRVRAGAVHAQADAFFLQDPLGVEFRPVGDTIVVANGGAGVWDHLLDHHDGVGAGSDSPFVTAVWADVRLP